jgi:hypothetical protein
MEAVMNTIEVVPMKKVKPATEQERTDVFNSKAAARFSEAFKAAMVELSPSEMNVVIANITASSLESVHSEQRMEVV